MSAPPGKTTFTLAEAAGLLSCHRETLRRAIKAGELRAAKLGRGFRISRSDLEAFWTACGGGDLFGRDSEGEPPAQADGRADGRKDKPGRDTPDKQPKDKQLQLTLPVGEKPEGPE